MLDKLFFITNTSDVHVSLCHPCTLNLCYTNQWPTFFITAINYLTDSLFIIIPFIADCCQIISSSNMMFPSYSKYFMSHLVMLFGFVYETPHTHYNSQTAIFNYFVFFFQYRELIVTNRSSPAKCLTVMWILGQCGSFNFRSGLKGELCTQFFKDSSWDSAIQI